ncbi:phosphatidylinositol kinase [Paenibacillus sp. TAB 01]|uniref:phosphatidylinositol kinase n=1 Tax=Paenibacillus sp. TAB 01 TaxID=3368988 RepID=UPI003750B044
MYEVVDITNWKTEKIRASGSKEKSWYRRPEDNKLFLFKLPVSLTSESWRVLNESTGEMWSEKIAYEVGKVLNIFTHTVEIGCIEANDEIINSYGITPEKIKSGVIYGALCCSFLEEGLESLIEGADMISDFDYTYDRETLRGTIEIYNYDLLIRVFQKYNIIDKLYSMLIFDTLIGNTDRHQDNFGLIKDEVTRKLFFAPLYDNSSSLGRELTDDRIKLMYRDAQMLNSYYFGKKSASRIWWGDINDYKRLNSFEFFKKAGEVTPELKAMRYIVQLLTDDKIDEIVHKVPVEVMSDMKKDFVSDFLKFRRNYILEGVYK